MFHTINYAVDTTNMVDDYKYKLWYSDNSIIVERVYILFNFPPDSNSKPPSLETLKYDL